MLADISEGIDSIPRTHMVQGCDGILQIIPWSPHGYSSTDSHTYVIHKCK